MGKTPVHAHRCDDAGLLDRSSSHQLVHGIFLALHRNMKRHRDATAVSSLLNTEKTNIPRCGRMTGNPESAGLNRYVVGDERALQERKQRIHPGLESCRRYREVSLEA